MKLSYLTTVITGFASSNDAPGGWTYDRMCMDLLRWLAMSGIELPDIKKYELWTSDVEVSPEAAQRVLALHHTEKVVGDLRAMGEGIGRCVVNVPSNINVWQHLKGEGVLSRAAESLSSAAKELAKAATE